jgi:hypothetical protein
MPASLSVEVRLREGLKSLNCAERNFIEVANGLGQQISRGRFSQALAGTGKALSNSEGEQLYALVGELRNLQESTPFPIDWTKPDQVGELLTAKRAALKLLEEL